VCERCEQMSTVTHSVHNVWGGL